MISVLKASDKEKCGSLVKVPMLRAHLTLILLAAVHQRKVVFFVGKVVTSLPEF